MSSLNLIPEPPSVVEEDEEEVAARMRRGCGCDCLRLSLSLREVGLREVVLPLNVEEGDSLVEVGEENDRRVVAMAVAVAVAVGWCYRFIFEWIGAVVIVILSDII